MPLKMQSVLEKSKPKLIDRCNVCENVLHGYKGLIYGRFMLPDIPIAWVCEHCQTVYGLDNVILELGKFGSTHTGIA